MFEQLLRKIQLLFGRGKTIVGGQKNIQVEMLPGETRVVPLVHPYGLTSHPLEGSEAIIISQNGERNQCLAIICQDKRYQITLKPGEVALSDNNWQKIHLTNNGIEIKGNTTIQDNVTILGSLTVHGKIEGKSNIESSSNIIASGNLEGAMCLAGGYAGAGGSSVKATTNIETTEEVIANGIRLTTHTHPITKGSSKGNTGSPS